MSVKVAVRVRPFNQKEKESNSVLCINMNGKFTTIKDELQHEKPFSFDYSFWSHDGFTINNDGYYEPIDEIYYDQKRVFDCMGKQILDNAWEGYNCCLFAYGQTGSGKSYSMVGYGANKGIVPISCEEIFKRIKENTNDERSYEVLVSMLEIYNEKIQDLLVPINDRVHGGLKVRESKIIGVFVDGLSKHPVQSYEEIAKKMEEGYENRTIGSTLMNATSSRAHTIVTIEFKQIHFELGKKNEKISVINLVDLAGSERAASTGATGDRLKEGCNINKSLLVLGNVINTLADKAMGRKKDILPPYRDSALTRILQNALGGNSKTVMICALSPASINFEETLSTLRYADRAKKIQNKAVVNESEHDKMVRLLKEENGELKKMIEELNKKIMLGGILKDEDKNMFQDLTEQYDATSKMMLEMQKTFSEKVEESKILDKNEIESKVDINFPHLVVLNEDPQLSHKLKYSLKQTPFYIGRKHGVPKPHLNLSGIGIKVNHAVICEIESKLRLIPNDNGAMDFLFVNGRKMDSKEGFVLNHLDRITFGTNSIFIFMVKSNGEDIYQIDWEDAQKELHESMEEISRKQRMEIDKKKIEDIELLKKDMELKFEKEKLDVEEKMKQQLKEYEEKLKEMNESVEQSKLEKKRKLVEQNLINDIKLLESEQARKKREIDSTEKLILQKIEIEKELVKLNQNQIFEQNLRNVVRKLNKLKIICSEFKRNINLELSLINPPAETYTHSNYKNNPKLLIKVENFEEGTVYFWDIETFYNRYDLMKDLLHRFQDGEIDILNLSHNEDPLWDEPQRSVLGYSFYWLSPLAYLMNNDGTSLPIIMGERILGSLIIDVIPMENGLMIKDNDNIPDDPYDLEGNPLQYVVYIKEAKDLPENFCKEVQVEYACFHDNMKYATKTHKTQTTNPIFDEYFEHRIEYLYRSEINYLLKKNICFTITAFEEVEKKGKISNLEPRDTSVYLEKTDKENNQFEDKPISNTNVIFDTLANNNFKCSEEIDIKINSPSVHLVKASIPINTNINKKTKEEIRISNSSKHKPKSKSKGCIIF